jgi:hypothetical protein
MRNIFICTSIGVLIIGFVVVTQISYGDYVVDSIGSIGETDTYTFEGSEDDKVTIRMCATSGGLDPTLELFGPNNNLLIETWADTQANIVDYVLPDSGTFTLCVCDYENSETGNYWLSLQCRQNIKARADTIYYDSLYTEDSISPYGDMDAYIFQGNENDSVTIQMSIIVNPSELDPMLELFDSNDNLLAEVWGNANAKILNFVLPHSDTYVLFLSDYAGDEIGDYWFRFQKKIVTSVNNNQSIPFGFTLGQNYPNPFNPVTTIKYQIPELSFVTLKVFDVLGREIATIVNEEKPIGSYEVEFNAASLPSGIYLYQLRSGNYVETKKMIILK